MPLNGKGTSQTGCLSLSVEAATTKTLVFNFTTECGIIKTGEIILCSLCYLGNGSPEEEEIKKGLAKLKLWKKLYPGESYGCLYCPHHCHCYEFLVQDKSIPIPIILQDVYEIRKLNEKIVSVAGGQPRYGTKQSVV